jgi:hypothetical protein
MGNRGSWGNSSGGTGNNSSETIDPGPLTVNGTSNLNGPVNAKSVNVTSTGGVASGPTVSGAAITAGTNYTAYGAWDSTRTANNRYADWFWTSGALSLRFANDAVNTSVTPLSVSGGQAGGITGIASNSGSGSWAHTGNMSVQNGLLSSSAGAGVASPTNSGINLGYASSWSIMSMYDGSRTADNRTADVLFINGGFQVRFANDARSSFKTALNIAGGAGAAGITGITSDSGSGSWTHTGTMGVTQSGGNGINISPSANGGTPTITTTGANTNVSLNIATQGSGGINLQTSTAVTGNLSVSGTSTLTGAVSMPGGTSGTLRISEGFIVSTLPAASTALKGARAYVTDANDGANMVWNNPVTTGGGANTVPVFCNGNSWVYG